VVRIAAVAPEVGLVAIDRLSDRDRPIVIVGRVPRLAAAKAARDFEGLPIAQDGGRRSRFKGVGEPDLLEPLSARGPTMFQRPRFFCSRGEYPARRRRSMVSCRWRAARGRSGFQVCWREASAWIGSGVRLVSGTAE